MPSLIIAFTLAVTGVILSSFALTAFGLPKEIAGSISSAIIGGIPYLHNLIEARVKCKDSENIDLLPFESFSISAPIMVVYTCAMLFAAISIGSGVGFLVASIEALVLGANEFRLSIAPVLVTVILITFPTVFFIGRWVGIRCKSHGIAIIIISTLVVRVICSLLDYYFLPDQDFFDLYGKNKSIEQFSNQLLNGLIGLSIVGGIGYWRGRKNRMAFYLVYLLKAIRPKDREALVSLAYEEAKNVLKP